MGTNSKKLRCNKCSKIGHKSINCPDAKAQQQQNAKCFLCGKSGHKKNECPKLSDRKEASTNIKDDADELTTQKNEIIDKSRRKGKGERYFLHHRNSLQLTI